MSRKLKPKTVNSIYIFLLILGAAMAFAGLEFGKPLTILGILMLIGNMMFRLICFRCPHCGRYLDRSSGEFCPYCGKTIE